MVTLLKKDRKDLILRQINVHSRVSFNDLATMLNVSEDTIRRDLNELSSVQKIVKVKGGAMAKGNEFLVENQQNFAQESKIIIAKKAVKLLKDGMLVLVGGGTTVREFIAAIPENLKATFVTLNPYTCIHLMAKPNIDTILVGGKVSNYSQAVIGGDAFLKLREIKADLCVVGTNGIDPENGLTDSHWETVEIKKALFLASKKIMVLAISEKLNSTLNLKICGLEEVDYLVSELDKDHESLEKYRYKNVILI